MRIFRVNENAVYGAARVRIAVSADRAVKQRGAYSSADNTVSSSVIVNATHIGLPAYPCSISTGAWADATLMQRTHPITREPVIIYSLCYIPTREVRLARLFLFVTCRLVKT